MKMWNRLNNQSGFTLVELLVTVVITAIIGTAILTLYTRNLRTYSGQLQVTEAQQNVRAGIESLVFDLRMAGYDPTNEAGATFLQATSTVIQFNQDLNEDGDFIDTEDADGDGNVTEADMNERITYSLYPADGSNRLGRDTGNGNQPVAEFLDAVGFAYAFDRDGDDLLDVDAGGRIHWAIVGANGNWWEFDANNDDLITIADDTDSNGTINTVDTGVAADLDDIRAVKIWLLGRAPQAAQDYTNTSSYLVGNTVTAAANDSFRRRLLTTSVVCRNMGI